MLLLVNNKILLLAPKNKLYFSFIHHGSTGVWCLNYHIQFYTLAYNSIQKYTIVYKSIRKYTKVYSLLMYTEVYCS